MPVEQIASALIAAAGKCRHVPTRRASGILIFIESPTEACNMLAEALRSIELTRSLENMRYHIRSGTSDFDLFHVSNFLLSRVVDGVDPRIVAQSLVDILMTKTTNIWQVQAFTSLPVPHSFDLDEDVGVYSSEDFPIIDDDFQIYRAHYPRWFELGDPTGAIIIRSTSTTALYDGKISEYGCAKPPDSLHAYEKDVIKRATQALIISSKSVPDLLQRFPFMADPGWPGLTISTGGLSQGYPRQPVINGPADPEVASRIYKALANHKYAKVFDLAIDRLEEFRRNRNPSARSIEIGTCVEVLLTHGEQEGNSEISYKLRTRAAWLIGRSYEERTELLRVMRDLYANRSAAVHSGVSADYKKATTAAKFSAKLLQYDDVAVRLLERLIGSTKWPDWNKLVLGGGAE